MSYGRQNSYARRDPYFKRDPYAKTYGIPRRYCTFCRRDTYWQDAGRRDAKLEQCIDCGAEEFI